MHYGSRSSQSCLFLLIFIFLMCKIACTQKELLAYLVACRGAKIDRSHPKTFSQEVLAWWAAHHTPHPLPSLGSSVKRPGWLYLLFMPTPEFCIV
eukprot:scaffold93844_cov39-Tisochrysis_lutea.AAC.1